MEFKRPLKNQYRGINAHLHSYWQEAGGWDSFHGLHISDLTRSLNRQLAPLGYEADFTKSLQIWHPSDGDEVRRPISDVTIYDTDPGRRLPEITPYAGQAGELVLPLPELLTFDEPDLKTYRAVAVYELTTDLIERGEPVAWIELLSPSNKPPHSDFENYDRKRKRVLQSGIVFVEIDYLHEQPTTFERLPSYQPRQKGLAASPASHPYRITVVDPRPYLMEGTGRSHGFDVDDPIPTMVIPLNGDDRLEFDFGAPYQRTFEEMLYGRRVDYTQPPLNFERYSQDDQARILCRMIAVIQAAQASVDLEANAPLPVESLSLGEAKRRYELLINPA